MALSPAVWLREGGVSASAPGGFPGGRPRRALKLGRRPAGWSATARAGAAASRGRLVQAVCGRRPWRGEKGLGGLPMWNKPGQEVAKDARYEESRQRLLVHVAAEGFGCITRLASCLAIDFPARCRRLGGPYLRELKRPGPE